MNIIQTMNDNIIQPIINYAYEHPGQMMVTSGAIALGSAAVFAPGIILAHKAALTFAALSLGYELGVKPYYGESINSLVDISGHPYVAAIAGVGLTSIVGGPILGYMYAHKALSVVALSVPTLIAASNFYLLGHDEAMGISKSCLDQTISIELPVDLYFHSNKAIIGFPMLGFYSSCSVRKGARAYFLTDEKEDLLEIFAVGFGSGMIGGSFKYGVTACAYGASWATVAKKAFIGAVNNGIYGLSAAINMDNNEIQKNYTDVVAQVDLFSCFVAEPLDVVLGGELSMSGIVESLHVAGSMYMLGSNLLSPTEHLTTALGNLTEGYASHDEL